ncbi:hypothetical protein [Aurantibacter crassamenti]|uniref:hypothetical protein n=1 Tax=Aurantibacter crassamenti TaxID=1837375 RepID=UPI001EEE04EB|nr:hypothetical protein [Aurantibacter crassamenti]
MTTQIKSIFNLIEIFRNGKRKPLKTINTTSHCEQKYHHDFYCDAKNPITSN